MYLKRSHYWFLTLSSAVVLVGAVLTFLLPDKYFFDAQVIVADVYNRKGLIGSYPFSMWFYHVTRLGRLPFFLIALLQLPIVFFAVSRLGIPHIFNRAYLRNALIWITMVIFGVYLAIPSKEFITLLYVNLIAIVMVSSWRLRSKLVVSVLLFLFFGAWFRQYFILIPVLGIVLYLVSQLKVRNRAFWNVLAGLMIATFLSLAFGLVKGEFMTASFRERINEVRVGREDSQTIITSPVPPDNIANEGISIFYGFFSVNLPVNGLRFFYKPQVLAFVVWQLLLFGYLIYFYNHCLKNRKVFRHEEWVFHFLFAYLIIQGIFEPDLGSAVKHKLGLFPLIYLAMYYDQGLLKRRGNIQTHPE